MRRSLDKSGFTKIDHVTFDVILPLLSTAAQSIFLRIYRQTAGWNKPFDQISLSQFQDKTGIKHVDTVRAAIEELKDMDLIIVMGKRTQKRSYGINFDTLSGYVTEEVE
jgi:hypothetical protein